MVLVSDRYTYRVQWSEEDEEYVGLCAEFPSLSWLAATPEDALSGIRSVVGAVVIDMTTDSGPLEDKVISNVNCQ
jgi:predicted RNase H-like HicB family nuclease